MKKINFGYLIVLLVLFSSFSTTAFAESKSDKYLGKRVPCIIASNVQDSYILDNQTILFRTVFNVVYINRLPDPCPGLKVADKYSHEVTIDRICKFDTIRVIEPPYGATSSCGLGEFVEFIGPKTIREAIKILKDEGVLDMLVKENAFNAPSKE